MEIIKNTLKEILEEYSNINELINNTNDEQFKKRYEMYNKLLVQDFECILKTKHLLENPYWKVK